MVKIKYSIGYFLLDYYFNNPSQFIGFFDSRKGASLYLDEFTFPNYKYSNDSYLDHPRKKEIKKMLKKLRIDKAEAEIIKRFKK